MPTVSTRWDIKSLIEYYAQINIVSSAIVHGIREFHSNCPWCGGNDRFITRPETGQYTCSTRSSGCGKHGDAIDFLVEYALMSRYDAMEELALQDVSFYDDKPSGHHPDAKEQAPNCKWQESGMLLVERAEHALHAPVGREMLAYLHARGLNDETIKHFRYGYMPLRKDGSWFQESFEAWGLDAEQLTPAQREKGCVRIPPGIIIPWFEGNSLLWRLAIKRPGEPKGRDYGQIVGSGEGMYNIFSVQYSEPCMMVESEFCAASVWQEAGDLVNCVATGSTTRARLGRWIADLSLSSFVLQSYDEDEEDANGLKSGDEGAEYWLKMLKHSMRWSPMFCKDPNDILRFQLAGASEMTLRQWVQYGLAAARIEFNIEDQAITPAGLSAQKIEENFLQQHTDCHTQENIPLPYKPRSLPKLPRAKCPGSRSKCKQKPLTNGWCEEHKLNYELLCLGNALNYPCIAGTRRIESGIVQWEAHAEVYSLRLAEDIARIKVRYSGFDLKG